MTPAALLDEARNAGVTLWLEGDVLRYRGPREALAKLLPALKAHKPDILAALAHPDPLPPLASAAEAGRRKVLAMLAGDGDRYAVAVDDPNTDPVVMALATPDGTCEVRLPKERYDAFRVLEMVRGWEA